MLQLRSGDVFANNYRLTRLIDTGGFADVWEAVFLTAGNTVALKIFPKLDAEGIKNIEMEYTNQSELSHSNLLIARYFGFHDGYPFLEMKYCSGGNASDRIGKMDEVEFAKCIRDISSALEYLHENNIVHRDIKPNNILIDKNGKYYLADMGLSLKLQTTIQKFTTSKNNNNGISGTTPPCYRAPELCDRSSIGSEPIKATDIWALGATLFELATSNLPFSDLGGCGQINNPIPPDLNSSFSKELNNIIKKCLAKDTWDRPKAVDLVKLATNYTTLGKWLVDYSQKEFPSTENTDFRAPKDENKLKKSNWSLVLGLVFSVILSVLIGNFINENNHGKLKLVNNVQIYYTKDITEDNLKAVEDFINKSGFLNSGNKITIQIAKKDDVYQFKEVVKKGVETNEELVPYIKSLTAQLSSAVFDGATVEFHYCDDHLRTLRIVPMALINFGKLKVFDAIQMFYTEDITDDQVNILGNYLLNAGWGAGSSKAVHITKSNGAYQFRLIVKKGLENDEEYTASFKIIAAEISEGVFNNERVELHACDENFNTVRVFLMK